VIEGYCTSWKWKTDTDGIRLAPGIPLSAAANDVVHFHVSSETPYTVRYLRLRNPADMFDPIAMAPPLAMPAGVQAVPPEPWLGCNWQTSFSLTVPSSWPSGIYAAHCATEDGEDFYVVFIVRPAGGVLRVQPTQRQKRLAFMASTNTWNAYNGWGGRFQYSDPNAPELSFERPNAQTRPCPPYHTVPVDDPMARRSYESNTRTMARADLWILSWLEDAGYEVDVFTDPDFHAGSFDPAEYAGLILGTHPEYWSGAMRDRLDDYLNGGGRLLYLGGNGLYERNEYSSDLRLVLFRQGDPARKDRWVFAKYGRPQRAVLGVADAGLSWQANVTGYRTRAPTHRFLRNTGLVHGAAFGESGLTGTKGDSQNGKACGWEMDTSKPDDGGGPAPANCIVLAEALGHPQAAQMVCYERSGGFVFSVGSLTFGGSLVLDPILQQIVRNVLDECLAVRVPEPKVKVSDTLIWLREGILALGPTGPVPVPPHGPMLDILLGVVISSLADQLSDANDQTELRRAGLDVIARAASRAHEALVADSTMTARPRAAPGPLAAVVDGATAGAALTGRLQRLVTE
jgi:hypothetical protein